MIGSSEPSVAATDAVDFGEMRVEEGNRQMSDLRVQKPNRRRRRGTGSVVVRSGAYYGKWRGPDGRQVMRRLGPVRPRGTREGLTQVQAEAGLRRLMSDAHPSVARGDRRTIAELAETHLAIKRNAGLKRSTARGYESVVSAHLLPFFGERTIDKINDASVAGFDKKLREEGLRAQTRRNILGLLGAMLSTAKKKGWVSVNVVADYEKPRKGRSDVDGELRYLTLEEVEAVLHAMPDEPVGRTEGALILAAAMTGMRRGELLGLRWKDVDWEARKLRVVRTYVGGKEDTPKSESSRRAVPLANRLADELERLRKTSPYTADDEPVFTHPGGTGLPLDGSAVSKSFKRALRRADVRDVRFHDLRHTFGTMMASSPNVSMRTLQRWLGHSDPATTAIYAHFAPSDHEADWVDEVFAPSPRGAAVQG
jgi:integrase